jgi:putative DNA primase/helicase
VVLPDNDDPGRAHAQSVAQALLGIAVTVKCIELPGLPEKGDVSDWLAEGHTVAELQAIADAADFWRPEEHTGVDAPARTAARMASVAGNEAYHLTDLGNAKRLVFQHGRDLRYCHPLHRWFVYDGRRWREDAAGEVLRRAKETVKSMYAEAGQISDAEMRKNLVGWAMRSESAERIAAMVRLAESESQVVVRPEQLDADPWLLNCLNGTIDLRARQLRPHRREDLITRLAPVEFDPDAHLALWDETLAYAFPDLDVRAFVQSAVGYSATADISEEKFFMLIGPTSSGKTTIVEAVKATLGDYAATADIRSFLAAQDDRGPRNDIARLAGRRFIPSVEVDQGKRLAEGLVKLLSGGDTVVARRLYQEEFEFPFTGKVWIIANHAPRVRDDDDALWRRIVRIPSQQIPEERRDKAVKERLRDPRLAGPAILAWIVKGATEWQQRGLDVPDAVATATDEYRKEMDVLQPFFESVCVFGPNAEVEARALREAYEGWCRENGERPLSGRTVGQRLRERGCESQKRAGGRRVWVGIGLVAAGTSGGSGGSGVKM